jgi:phenylacetate-CoA ligase
MASGAVKRSKRLYITTGGSTGVPVGFYLQKGVSRPKEQAFLEGMWKRAGYFKGARVAVIRGHVTSERGARQDCSVRRYPRLADAIFVSPYHRAVARVS